MEEVTREGAQILFDILLVADHPAKMSWKTPTWLLLPRGNRKTGLNH